MIDKKQKCKECNFSDEDRGVLYCREASPKIIPIQRVNPLNPREVEQGFLSMFPQCPQDERGCGRYVCTVKLQ